MSVSAFHTFQDTIATAFHTQRQEITTTPQLVSNFLDLPEDWLGTLQIRYRSIIDWRISSHDDGSDYVLVPADEWVLLAVVNGQVQTYVMADSGSGTLTVVVEGRVRKALPKEL